MIRLVFFGGRWFHDWDMARRNFDAWGRPDVLISGMAAGADFIGTVIAKSRGVPVEPYPADWALFGDAAGPIRNQQMIDEGRPTHAVAMPGGAGTNDMLMRLSWAGVPVVLGV